MYGVFWGGAAQKYPSIRYLRTWEPGRGRLGRPASPAERVASPVPCTLRRCLRSLTAQPRGARFMRHPPRLAWLVLDVAHQVRISRPWLNGRRGARALAVGLTGPPTGPPDSVPGYASPRPPEVPATPGASPCLRIATQPQLDNVSRCYLGSNCLEPRGRRRGKEGVGASVPYLGSNCLEQARSPRPCPDVYLSVPYLGSNCLELAK